MKREKLTKATSQRMQRIAEKLNEVIAADNGALRIRSAVFSLFELPSLKLETPSTSLQ